MTSSYLERPIRGYSEALAQAHASPSYKHHLEGEAWERAHPERARARHALLAMFCDELVRTGMHRTGTNRRKN